LVLAILAFQYRDKFAVTKLFHINIIDAPRGEPATIRDDRVTPLGKQWILGGRSEYATFVASSIFHFFLWFVFSND
jgi:hypothetical protein